MIHERQFKKNKRKKKEQGIRRLGFLTRSWLQSLLVITHSPEKKRVPKTDSSWDIEIPPCTRLWRSAKSPLTLIMVGDQSSNQGRREGRMRVAGHAGRGGHPRGNGAGKTGLTKWVNTLGSESRFSRCERVDLQIWKERKPEHTLVLS